MYKKCGTVGSAREFYSWGNIAISNCLNFEVLCRHASKSSSRVMWVTITRWVTGYGKWAGIAHFTMVKLCVLDQCGVTKLQISFFFIIHAENFLLFMVEDTVSSLGFPIKDFLSSYSNYLDVVASFSRQNPVPNFCFPQEPVYFFEFSLSRLPLLCGGIAMQRSRETTTDQWPRLIRYDEYRHLVPTLVS